MKKIYLLLATVLLSTVSQAADELTVPAIIVPQGGLATLSIQLTNPDKSYTAGQMLLRLPDGITTVLNDKGDPMVTKGDRITTTDHSIGATHLEDGTDQFTIFSISSDVITGTEGTIFTITVNASSDLAVGTILEGKLENIEMTTTDATPTPFNDKTFSITIGDNRLVLDESSTAAPEAAAGVNVRVLRTIKADEWSTICLPFAMTAEQVKEAFGNDVQLGDFSDTQSTYDDDDRVASISISFDDATEIEANHPYIIKVSSPITEFTVDNVDIDPAEEDALIEVDNGLTGRRRVVYGGFYGTYHAQTTLEEFSLFLSDNQFWYSTGKTKMKAFRAYFVMADVLTDVENAAARIGITFDDLTTGIRSVKGEKREKDDAFYNLNGQRVKTLRQGLYIRNGKKIVKREKGGEQ